MIRDQFIDEINLHPFSNGEFRVLFACCNFRRKLLSEEEKDILYMRTHMLVESMLPLIVDADYNEIIDKYPTGLLLARCRFIPDSPIGFY